MAWQRVRIPLPPGLDPLTREEIAQEIIEYIRQRTASGEGYSAETKRARSFPSYTPQYAKRKGFPKAS
jgi:hypothetical protein